jgi:hypothetical protein
MIHDPDALLDHFCGRFFGHVAGTSPEDVHAAWHNLTARTQFIAAALAEVAGPLGLTVEREFMAVDHVCLGGEANVPIIAIESENRHDTVTRELAKLTAFAAPLRLLITVAEWSDGFGGSSGGVPAARLLADWRNQVQQRLKAWPRKGIVAAIVGEWGRDDQLRFYPHRLSETPAAERIVAACSCDCSSVPFYRPCAQSRVQ